MSELGMFIIILGVFIGISTIMRLIISHSTLRRKQEKAEEKVGDCT